jgi:acetylornithine/succinyldiaminopimelate/putrescine aminotransferase
MGIARSELTCRLCYEWDGIKPDMVILGKALSGGSECPL